MKKILPLVTLLLFLTGCEQPPTFNVGVNSFQRPGALNFGTYVLIPSEEGVNQDDLEFVEYSSYVERVLSEKGFEKNEDFNEADIAIFLSYGIGDPERVNYSYSLPTWGKTGVASSHTTGTVNVIGNTATYTGTTTNVPSFGITGYRTQNTSYDVYTRRAFLSAYDLKEYRATGKENMIWDTRIVSTGTSGDLRRVFPILIAAAKEYIGANTGRIVQVSLKEADKRVLEVKGLAENKK